MIKLKYKLNNIEKVIEASSKNKFFFGQDEVLSNALSDPLFDQKWYKKGYKVFNAFNEKKFQKIKKGVKKTIINTLKEKNINHENFSLENYHNFIKHEEDHYKIVSKTRDLFNKDFEDSIRDLKRDLEKSLNIRLSNKNPKNNETAHIIIRIIRPKSNDYNPPHKDMYEAIDGNSDSTYFSKQLPIINFWIPICGLSSNTSLPIVPGSHLINEKEILRTQEGAIMNGNKYRVRLIKDWGDNKFLRPIMNYGDVLIFSSYLIHGLGTNDNDKTTRMSLEFRLFKS